MPTEELLVAFNRVRNDLPLNQVQLQELLHMIRGVEAARPGVRTGLGCDVVMGSCNLSKHLNGCSCMQF